MSVDKFGRSSENSVTSGLILRQANNKFLRRDGKNDMLGDLLLSSVGSDSIRQLGCSDLTPGKGFSLVLGNMYNQLQFANIPTNHAQTPVTLETTHGFLVRAADQDICRFGGAGDPPVNIYKNVVMNSKIIKNLSDPTDPQDAATKNYVDTRLHKDVYRAVGSSLSTGRKALALSNLAVPTQGSGGAVGLQSGLYKVFVMGVRSSGPSFYISLIVAGQGDKRTCEVGVGLEFDFSAVIKLTAETLIALNVQHQESQQLLNIEATLVVERLL